MKKIASSPRQASSQTVSINLLSGETLDGYLRGFSSAMHELHFFRTGADGQVIEQWLAAKDIVYIGQHHNEQSNDLPTYQEQKLEELKITTIHSETFHVQAYPALPHAPGFFAISNNKFTPYRRIFFYRRGIHFEEQPEKLGDLLISENLASPQEIQHALDLQKKETPPLGVVLKEQGKITVKDIKHALDVQRHKDIKLGDILMERKQVTQMQIKAGLKEQIRSKKALGTIFVETGVITSKDLLSALHFQKHQKLRLGEILVEAKLITDLDLDLALAEQKVRGLRLGEILLSTEVITEDQLLYVLAKKFHLPAVDLDTYSINEMAESEVTRSVIEKYQVLPIDSDQHTLTIALSDPLGLEAYDQIAFATGKKIHEVMVKGSQLKARIEHYVEEEEYSDELSCEFLHQDGDMGDEEYSELEITESTQDAPIVRLVNRIISNGLKKEASDIHILPQSNRIILAYRLNGQLISESALDKSLHAKISARIKILSGMNIAERRMPQDGRMILRDGKRKYEFRVSCIPNAYGESLVLRVLNKDMAVDLDMLGLRDEDIQHLSDMAHKPYGLILVTGPTGSGKSTTLFAVLKSLSDMPVHILTIEDPVESEIKDANQIQVNNQIGLTFARVLRNVLRHDPDVIMIGEMRDEETASIGIEAALTGHLMLSTLHTNSAVDTIIRLNDLNIPNYLIAPSLLGVMSQTLLKKLCVECRQAVAANDVAFARVKSFGFGEAEQLYEAVGCSECHETGYSGRVMAYEFLVVNEVVRQAIHDGVTGQALQRIAVESGMEPKAKVAFQLAVDGVIDYKDFIYSAM
ncbi:MAG: ATPase, T2SS/T4P/T4SS family [Mariprofundaceae bacterium]|nr:ATPase, T2SS/T4P/T4SS family [Mariprofundaceae bacterium]